MSKLKVNNLEPLTGDVVSVASNLVVDGTLTAKVLKTELTQSAILYESGSSKFGDTYDDKHQFTGSIELDGLVEVKGNDNKIKFYYPTFASLPPADDWHGMFAHAHDTGKGYYAHAGQWIPFANEAKLIAISESIDTTITDLSSSIESTVVNLSSSIDTTVTDLSSSIESTVVNLSSSIDTSITALSSSTDAHLDAEISFLSESADVQRKYYHTKAITGQSELSGSAHSARTSLNTSLLGKVNVEKNRIDAILSSSVADTDTFAEIVTLINSVDTENDTAFAGFVTSSNTRIDENSDLIAALSSSTALVDATERTDRITNDTALADEISLLSTELKDEITILSSSVLVVTEQNSSDIANSDQKTVFNKGLIDNINLITGSLLDTQEEWNNKKDMLQTSGSVAGSYLSIERLKDIVSGSADFIEFQSKINAL